MSNIGVRWHLKYSKIRSNRRWSFSMKSDRMWQFWYVSINCFWIKIFHYDNICLSSSDFMKVLLEFWEIIAWNMIENSLCEIWPYLVKSIASRIFLLVKKCIQLTNWVKRNKKFTTFCQNQHFVDILKTVISLAPIWVFLYDLDVT